LQQLKEQAEQAVEHTHAWPAGFFHFVVPSRRRRRNPRSWFFQKGTTEERKQHVCALREKRKGRGKEAACLCSKSSRGKICDQIKREERSQTEERKWEERKEPWGKKLQNKTKIWIKTNKRSAKFRGYEQL
jgi:hypothetical protein